VFKEIRNNKRNFFIFQKISKCHPWGSHGYDPVPNKLEEKHERTKKLYLAMEFQ
jgi:Uncharacterized conserved protein